LWTWITSIKCVRKVLFRTPIYPLDSKFLSNFSHIHKPRAITLDYVLASVFPLIQTVILLLLNISDDCIVDNFQTALKVFVIVIIYYVFRFVFPYVSIKKGDVKIWNIELNIVLTIQSLRSKLCEIAYWQSFICGYPVQ